MQLCFAQFTENDRIYRWSPGGSVLLTPSGLHFQLEAVFLPLETSVALNIKVLVIWVYILWNLDLMQKLNSVHVSSSFLKKFQVKQFVLQYCEQLFQINKFVMRVYERRTRKLIGIRNEILGCVVFVL
jgi:hypothetical protein